MPGLLKKLLFLGVTVTVLSNVASPARAAFFYIDDPSNPSNNGDLSDDRNNPTDLGVLMEGENTIVITINNPLAPQPLDKDYFTFKVPGELALDKIILTQYLGGDDAAFIGMQAGKIITVDPPTSPPNPDERKAIAAQLLGYTLVGTNPAASVIKPVNDILPSMCLTANRPPQPSGEESYPPMGCTPPLSGGTSYSFWVQQTARTVTPTKFELKFIGAKVPEPTSALSLLAFGALGASLIKKRQDKF